MKEVIRELINEFHKEALPRVVKRDIEIPHLPPDIRKALVFIGMRRVGKTFLMYQHMQNQLSEGIEKKKLMYLNFEDDRLANFSIADFQSILDVYFELYPELVHALDLKFYFDEIQNIEGWEKFIRRLLDKEKMGVYVTGSSSKSLSKEIATSLRGRCLVKEVFTLSFLEYLNNHGIDYISHLDSKEKAAIKHHCHNYLADGGFPETMTLSPILRRQTIQSYVNTAVFRDVIDRHQLSNPHVIKLFLTHCLQNISAPLSITKVYNTFKSTGMILSRGSLYEYLDYFEDAYLLYSVQLFDLSTRKRHVNPPKIYCTDSGIINSYSIKPHMEYSSCLENAIYIQLRRNGFENIYYYKTDSGKEVDFVTQQINGKLELFQVCLDLTDEKTSKREISALEESAHELQLDRATIITLDTTDSVELKNLTIKIIPFWQWASNTN